MTCRTGSVVTDIELTLVAEPIILRLLRLSRCMHSIKYLNYFDKQSLVVYSSSR